MFHITGKATMSVKTTADWACITGAEQYKAAIAFDCPFCGAKVGVQCRGVVFPQYPHTRRLDATLAGSRQQAPTVK